MPSTILINTALEQTSFDCRLDPNLVAIFSLIMPLNEYQKYSHELNIRPIEGPHYNGICAQNQKAYLTVGLRLLRGF